MRARAGRLMGADDCICAVETMLWMVGSGQTEEEVKTLSHGSGRLSSGVYFRLGMVIRPRINVVKHSLSVSLCTWPFTPRFFNRMFNAKRRAMLAESWQEREL